MVLETFLSSLAGWEIILFIVLVFSFLLCGSVTAIIILLRLRWNFKVVVLENVSGLGYVVSIRDRARLVKVGDGGEELFLLRKKKLYKVGYGKRIGNKTIAWAIGSDGYWYNITFGDLDTKLAEVGVNPVDRDMRFATASSRKLIENRYNEKSWMDKYASVLYFGLFTITLLIFGGIMWFAFDKQLDIAQANSVAIQTSKEVMEIAKQVLSSVDNIKTGGSGLIPA